jgi:integrase
MLMALYKRGKTWHTDFSVNGQRYRQSLDTTDWREAQAKQKELIGRASAGRLTQESKSFSRLPFSEAVDQWLDEKRPRVAPKTYSTERERSNAPKRYFGQTRLRDIGVESILSYVRQRSRATIANATINRELDVIRGVLKRARLWHRVADDVRPLPARSNIGRALAPYEEMRLLQVAATRPEWQTARLAMILALNTTCRGCELKGLRWCDVDFIGRAITIRRSKTDAGIRTIPLNANAWQAILQLRARMKLFYGAEPQPDWYIFASGEGQGPRSTLNGATVKPDPTRPITTWRTAWRALTRAIECPECGALQAPAEKCANERCGVDIHFVRSSLAGLRFHDLRHHAITRLCESQASDATIMAIAGHVSESMLRHYSHVRQDAMRQALDRLSTGVPTSGYVTKHVTNVRPEPPPNSQVIEKIMVDVRGLEPLASSLRTRRSPN